MEVDLLSSEVLVDGLSEASFVSPISSIFP